MLKIRLSNMLLGISLLASVASFSPFPAQAADKISLLEWSGYDDPAFRPKFTEKYPDGAAYTIFGDEEEAFQKLRAGFKADLSHPCSQSIQKWREADLIQPLDTSKLTYWNDVMPAIKAMPGLMTDDKGTPWFLPFEWGNTLLVYNTDKVPADDVKSLKVFADPKYKDRISIGDNVDDAYALASLVIGVKDWTKMTDDQFKQASDFLRQVHKNVRLYWSDPTDLAQAISGGEIDIAWAWNDTAITVSKDGVKAVSKKDTAEGLSSWVCGFVMLKSSTGNKDEIYDYLNAVTDPGVSQHVVDAWGYGHSNAKGMASVDPAVLQAKGYADVDKFKANTLFQAPVPKDLKQKMIAEFEKIKAGY